VYSDGPSIEIRVMVNGMPFIERLPGDLTSIIVPNALQSGGYRRNRDGQGSRRWNRGLVW
jgi:hypothetical protein